MDVVPCGRVVLRPEPERGQAVTVRCPAWTPTPERTPIDDIVLLGQPGCATSLVEFGKDRGEAVGRLLA